MTRPLTPLQRAMLTSLVEGGLGIPADMARRLWPNRRRMNGCAATVLRHMAGRGWALRGEDGRYEIAAGGLDALHRLEVTPPRIDLRPGGPDFDRRLLQDRITAPPQIRLLRAEGRPEEIVLTYEDKYRHVWIYRRRGHQVVRTLVTAVLRQQLSPAAVPQTGT